MSAKEFVEKEILGIYGKFLKEGKVKVGKKERKKEKF